jgi:FlaA1/EpsC-like NDP-sugar epimerase
MSLMSPDSWSRPTKRFVFLALDTALVPISLYITYSLRYGTLAPLPYTHSAWILFAVMTLAAPFLVIAYRTDRIKLVTFETRAIMKLGLMALSLSIVAMVCSYLTQASAPRSVPAIFIAVFFLAAVTTRILALQLLTFLKNRSSVQQNVLVYGAGAAGIQLASALQQSHEARPVAFIDDNPNLHGLMVAGLPVYGPKAIQQLIGRRDIARILIAMPSASETRQKELIAGLSAYPAEVKVLPSYVNIMNGEVEPDTLRPVSPDELLGRDKVDLDIPEIAKTYAGRVVMVTGAGGSIGSELCRQLINCKPARIVLFEQGEFQLYSIDRDLRPQAEAAGIQVTTRLGSVTNKARVTGVIAEEGVEIILHAAAYKHVPLVEDNELEGARNNVLGTQVVAEAAYAAGIERFILISTDKAVRPTNVMGATKRMAELVVQDLQTRSQTTKFAMVRFGNVLGSSGSVLPLFQKQIEAGGPVTVSHKDVTRFFMTIPEAARLVLLAGSYARGGDVFVLDMGEPRRIIDIARQMITLSGRTVKDPVSGQGDIEIRVTGLRPGEKLYEELLIDDESLRPTPHPKILRAEEAMLSQIEIVAMIRDLQGAITEADTARLRRLIEARVEGYHVQISTTPG